MELSQKYHPINIDDIVGQKHLLDIDAPFRKLLKNNALPHSLFFGPPGCGKTTLARIIAKELNRPFYQFNATTIKIDEIRKIFTQYRSSLIKPIIFIDETHRLSKPQQEVLLPHMENSNILILGASTSNPYYALTPAIRSRSMLFELLAISNQDMQKLLNKIVQNEDIYIEELAKEYLIKSSSGDVRAMLQLLQSATIVSNRVTVDILKSLRPQPISAGSNDTNSHYELISALIKSIRGSDIDASVYWLARVIEDAEPPEFIARRLAILASEDIGNANPNALNLASSTLNIVSNIGYPEARIPLAQLVIYLASSPKSNSAYQAINKAQDMIRDGVIYSVPQHLKNHSKEYLYPHDFGGWIIQEYLPCSISQIYKSKKMGFEKILDEWIEKIKKSRD